MWLYGDSFLLSESESVVTIITNKRDFEAAFNIQANRLSLREKSLSVNSKLGRMMKHVYI